MDALAGPIRILLVYDSVNGEDLTNAVALNNSGMNLTRIVGWVALLLVVLQGVLGGVGGGSEELSLRQLREREPSPLAEFAGPEHRRGEVVDGDALDIGPNDHQHHFTHSPDRIWTETNCYLDLWIELLHALGFDPVPMLMGLLNADFEVDHWRFAKPSPESLMQLYGIEVFEAPIWRDLPDHLRAYYASGRCLASVEVDAYYLPDTGSSAYRSVHTKTTIVPLWFDEDEERVCYFHNGGLFEADGDDVRGLWDYGGFRMSGGLAPYVELIRVHDREPLTDEVIRQRVAVMARAAVRRLPARNPVAALAERVLADVDWLRTCEPEVFHQYAFATLRLCGSWAELVAAALRWTELAGAGERAAAALEELAVGAKSAQFTLARAARGRTTDVAGPLAAMAAAWDIAAANLREAYGTR
mgnify:CR=1 FL=1